MKRHVSLILLLAVAMPLLGQANQAMLAKEYCKGTWAENSSQRVRMHQMLLRIEPALKQQFPHETITYVAVNSRVINAWTIPGSNHVNVVCMPTAMIDFMSADGELAFVMGHETGHAVDESCKQAKAKNRNNLALVRKCEDRADKVGFFLITHSGFSPYEAGAAFGKLSMYSGDARETKFQELFQNHPMTTERIQHMHELVAKYQAESGGTP